MTRLLAIPLLPLLALGGDWTRFRGPNGSGISPDSGFPVEFGRGKNVVWRTAVRPGKSSPVLTARHVFLTASDGDRLYTQCFERASGKLLWERSVDRTHRAVANRLNDAAAITPVTDGENVYVFFKDFGMVAYDAGGKQLWQAPLGPFTNTMGLAAAPIVSGGQVVLLIDQLEGSFLAAFDRATGEMRWKAAREELEAWGTPLLYRGQILTVSRGIFGAHAAASGKRTATQTGLPATIVGSPIVDGDLLVVFGYGADAPQPFAAQLAKLDKNGDRELSADEFGDSVLLQGVAAYTGNRDLRIDAAEWDLMQRRIMGPNAMFALRLETDAATGALRTRELWRYEKSFTSVIPTALAYQGHIYTVKNGGILTALDAATGKVTKTGRIAGALGGYSSSPVAAEGRIYLASEEGKVAVIRAAPEWELLQVNDLGEGCYATPALAEGQIYLRTSDGLYRFGRK